VRSIRTPTSRPISDASPSARALRAYLSTSTKHWRNAEPTLQTPPLTPGGKPMANYLLAYKGGGMAASEKEQKEQMAAWGQWFGTLGSAVVDAGNPCGASKTVVKDGNVKEGGSGVTGYSVVKAD